MTAIEWTHPSVLALLDEAGEPDPYRAIEMRARDLVSKALENGWSGPPYDPFELADAAGLQVVARQDLDDARLVAGPDGDRIEFNPNRRPARVRFSVAHELGHFLFSDYADRPRYRSQYVGDQKPGQSDDWQLEVLCNIAAAELLMPIGAFPISKANDLSLPHLLDLRRPFVVSTEALLRRVVKLTNRPVCLFAAARLADGGYRIDYVVPSRAWSGRVGAGQIVSASGVLASCTAVGYSNAGIERWDQSELRVQAVGIPPFPGDTFPRVAGLLQPGEEVKSEYSGFEYVRGDASDPRTGSPSVIAHVVNNQASAWGGRGFAVDLMRRFPVGQAAYADWAGDSTNRKLGSVHLAEVGSETWVASLVAQSGYGDQASGRPRLRLGALRRSLRTLCMEARDRAATVHMPMIGTGQGGSSWPPVRDLVLEELVAQNIPVVVYVLEDQPMPEDVEPLTQLSLI